MEIFIIKANRTKTIGFIFYFYKKKYVYVKTLKFMIKELVLAFKEQAEHIKNVKSFNYEGSDLINAQNNNSTIQVFVEDDIFTEFIITKDLVKIQMNIDILDNIGENEEKLDVHDRTTKIAIVLIKLIEEKYKNILSVYDYNMLNVSHYSDDDLFGTRVSLYLTMPSPVNFCNINEFIDELNEYYKEEDKNITINKPEINIDELDINPIKLRK